MKNALLSIFLFGAVASVTGAALAFPRPLLYGSPIAGSQRDPAAREHDRHKKDKRKPDEAGPRSLAFHRPSHFRT